MSVTATVTIPFPILSTSPAVTFDVVVKTLAGVIVFGPVVQTNAPFNVVGLAAGDYVVYATYNGNTVGYCFTVADCECPVWSDMVITRSGTGTAVVYFLEITFDMSGGFPNCPFRIAWDDGVTPSSLVLSSLSEFTSHVGTDYTIKIHLFSDHATFNFINGGGVTCNATAFSLVYSCSPALMPVISIFKVGPVYKLRAIFPDCGSTCHDFTINYLQNYYYGGPADAGSVAVALDCGDVYPFTVDTVLSPSPSFYTGDPNKVAYFVHITDCCGTTISLVDVHN